MLKEKEAQEIIEKLIHLRKVAEETQLPADLKALKLQEHVCVEKFKYIITMKTSRYRSFANYEDLCQEGVVALMRAMKNYNPSKGSVFWWFHKYIDTRIARIANCHTAIRFPLRYAKDTIPHRESKLPAMVDPARNPESTYSGKEASLLIAKGMSRLPEREGQIISMLYGINGSDTFPMKQVCEKFQISRGECLKIMRSSMRLLKDSIKSS